MDVKIKKLTPEARIPEKSHKSDFCYDVWAVSEEEIAPNVWRYGLGFAAEICDDYEQILDDIRIDIDARPRSSIWNTGMILANCEATIDRDYRGEIKLVFYHIMPNMPRYKVGDKIAQIKMGITETMEFREVDELTATERGEGGFGSTGLK